jgi:hypothetical protein
MGYTGINDIVLGGNFATLRSHYSFEISLGSDHMRQNFEAVLWFCITSSIVFLLYLKFSSLYRYTAFLPISEFLIAFIVLLNFPLYSSFGIVAWYTSQLFRSKW